MAVRMRASAAGRSRGDVAPLLLPLLLLLAACTPRWQENQHLVRVGMSEVEIEDLLGTPSARIRVPAMAGRPALLRWQWGDSLSTLATGALFPDTIPERVLAIGFDETATVEFIRPPLPPWPGSAPSR
jgi:hypothetical protein